ncbi:MAG: Ig-like domain-containing protein [Clostridia bacterium]|nr:Ig-like domain-containing protein [Clostridia bacterium]
MKKIIALALTIAVLCCVPSFAFADVGYTTTVSLFDYDFETVQTGNGILSDIAGVSFPTVAGPDGDEDNTVFVPGSTTTDIATGLNDYSGTLVYDIDTYLSVFNKSYTLLYLRGSAAKSVIGMNTNGTMSFCGNLLQLDGSNMVFSEEGWYHIHAEFDFVSVTASMTISGTIDGEDFTASVEDVAMYPELTFTSVIRVYKEPTALGDSPYYIDNAKAYYKAPNFLMSAEGIDDDGNGLGADGVLWDGGKIEVSFTEPMSAETVVDANFTITNGFGREIPFTGTFNSTDNVYVITPSEDLAPRSEYTISATGLKTALGANADSDEGVVVKTVGAPFSIASVSDGTVSSSNVTYTVTVQNTTEATGYVVAVSYDGDKMNSVGLTPVSAADDYDVTLATGGDRTVFYLMTSDGTFELLDIFSE